MKNYEVFRATDTWLAENVVPNLTGTEYACDLFWTAFASVYQGARQTYGWEPWGEGNGKALAVVAHMGSPVEANFFQQLYETGYLPEFAGPYPLLDTAPLLFQAGFDPTSEQAYAVNMGIELPEGFKPHSALSDAQLTRRVWNHLNQRNPSR